MSRRVLQKAEAQDLVDAALEIDRLLQWIAQNVSWMGHPMELKRCDEPGCDQYAAIGWTCCVDHLKALQT